jgi:hypothetical protein
MICHIAAVILLDNFSFAAILLRSHQPHLRNSLLQPTLKWGSNACIARLYISGGQMLQLRVAAKAAVRIESPLLLPRMER